MYYISNHRKTKSSGLYVRNILPPHHAREGNSSEMSADLEASDSGELTMKRQKVDQIWYDWIADGNTFMIQDMIGSAKYRNNPVNKKTDRIVHCVYRTSTYNI